MTRCLELLGSHLQFKSIRWPCLHLTFLISLTSTFHSCTAYCTESVPFYRWYRSFSWSTLHAVVWDAKLLEATCRMLIPYLLPQFIKSVFPGQVYKSVLVFQSGMTYSVSARSTTPSDITAHIRPQSFWFLFLRTPKTTYLCRESSSACCYAPAKPFIGNDMHKEQYNYLN